MLIYCRQYLFKMIQILKKYLTVRCALSVYEAVGLSWNHKAADNRSNINQLTTY